MPDHKHDPVSSAIMHISITQPISDLINNISRSYMDSYVICPSVLRWSTTEGHVHKQGRKLQTTEDYDAVQGAIHPPFFFAQSSRVLCIARACCAVLPKFCALHPCLQNSADSPCLRSPSIKPSSSLF